jgi:hypothetical protein
MVCFHTENPDLGTFWRVLEWKRLIYSLVIWNILRPFGTFYGHLVYFPRFGIFSQVKSGTAVGKEDAGNLKTKLNFLKSFHEYPLEIHFEDYRF